MRILVATWTARQVGGAETYLARTLAALVAAGHDVMLCCETDEPDDRPRFAVPAEVETLRSLASSPAVTMARLAEWQPEVVYVHGLADPAVEEQLQALAPAVLFAHGYYGTCISGEKAQRFPIIRPCARQFGPACLALYYPRRCGGLRPSTFARDYRRQRSRQRLLRRYAAVLTHSEHMREEFVRHGAAGGRVVNCSITAPVATTPQPQPSPAPPDRVRVPHLVFAGRMDPLKGGEELLRATVLAHQELGSGLRVTLAGDGIERVRWERVAWEVGARHERLSIHFTGWLGPAGVARLLATADILVMPSLWPEPFGLIGQEANRQGVPVVAYATGGIPEWLTDGVNGCLAPGDPPTVEGLAHAIVRCLSDRIRHRAMRRAAAAAGYSRPDDLHMGAVLEVLRQAAAKGRPAQVVAFVR
ncbi:MAG TPA: glycosyltransferase family 4 protein [Vicinamibacterales bacterium]|jgi:glycosyltransferase involved in cell wall biosynthesis|nr:glycosyltransferase family 4 protein [Vicinamibacterales bacterium]